MCTRPMYRVPDAHFKSYSVCFSWSVALSRVAAAGAPVTSIQTVPCGRCIDCLKSRARMWTDRFLMEYDTRGKRGMFLTLTYDEANLPEMEVSCLSGDPDPDLRNACFVPILEKSALQKFFKRMRAADYEFSYIACGEYGSKGGRPHYHACIAGAEFSDVKPGGRSATLEKLWPFGQSKVGTITPASVAYTCGYVLKRAAVPQVRDGRPPEFQVMSRRPALGRRYIEEHLESIKRTGKVYTAAGSHPAPRYVERLLAGDDLYEFQINKEVAALRRPAVDSDLSPDDRNAILDADAIHRARVK